MNKDNCFKPVNSSIVYTGCEPSMNVTEQIDFLNETYFKLQSMLTHVNDIEVVHRLNFIKRLIDNIIYHSE